MVYIENRLFLELIQFIEKFEGIGDLPKHKQWAKEDAYEFAFKRFRNTYLTQEYIDKIKEEGLQISNEELPKIDDELEDELDNLPF